MISTSHPHFACASQVPCPLPFLPLPALQWPKWSQCCNRDAVLWLGHSDPTEKWLWDTKPTQELTQFRSQNNSDPKWKEKMQNYNHENTHVCFPKGFGAAWPGGLFTKILRANNTTLIQKHVCMCTLVAQHVCPLHCQGTFVLCVLSMVHHQPQEASPWWLPKQMKTPKSPWHIKNDGCLKKQNKKPRHLVGGM